MDLRQISYFVALFEEGSVTKAARRMNVVQPALSMQIAKLERELDQRLFDRLPKEMAPTAAARTLHRLVQPILHDMALARQHMMNLSKTVSGRVSIGILSSLANSVVPSVLARFSGAFPQVEVSMADGYSITFIDWLNDRALDLAVINKPQRKLGLVLHPLLDEEMVVVGGRDAELPIEAPVKMRDLSRLDLILPSPRHGLRVELDRHLAAEDIVLAPKLELDSLTAIEQFVVRSGMFSVLPSLAVSHGLADGTLKAYRIVEPRITRQLVIAHHQSQPMSPAATKLVEMMADELKATARDLQARIVG